MREGIVTGEDQVDLNITSERVVAPAGVRRAPVSLKDGRVAVGADADFAIVDLNRDVRSRMR
jgi:dihydroorotase-like cyclic amidohydrolase